MLIKFGADPYEREEEEDIDNVHGHSESDFSDDSHEVELPRQEEKKKKEKKKKPKRPRSSSPLLPFYEDYHMVEHSGDESTVEQAERPADYSSASEAEEEEQRREKKRQPRARKERPRKKQKVDSDLVQGVLQLLNAAQESSGGRQDPKKSGSESRQTSKAPSKTDGKEATKNVASGGGSGGRYTTVKTPLPRKTVKSLESISRQLCSLQAKVDELTQNQ